MFHRNVFKDPNNYFLQETQESVNKIEKFLSGASEDRPDIFRVNIVFFLPGEMFFLFSKKKAMKGIPFIFYSRKNKHFTLCVVFLYLIFGENKPRKSESIILAIWTVTEKFSVNKKSPLYVENQRSENIKTRNWRPV